MTPQRRLGIAVLHQAWSDFAEGRIPSQHEIARCDDTTRLRYWLNDVRVKLDGFRFLFERHDAVKAFWRALSGVEWEQARRLPAVRARVALLTEVEARLITRLDGLRYKRRTYTRRKVPAVLLALTYSASPVDLASVS